MLLVKTKLENSSIHGIGIFADQFIPKGTPTWKFMPGFDLVVTKDQLDVLSQPAREQFLKYAYLYLKTDEYILCFDDARFMNHANEANTFEIISDVDNEEMDVAARDIFEGEELTANYKEYDGDFESKMSAT